MKKRTPDYFTVGWLLDKYGPRLSVQQLAECLSLAPGTVRNKLSNGTLDVPTYIEGGNRWADYRDVALYLDDLRSRAVTRAPDGYTGAGSANLHAR